MNNIIKQKYYKNLAIRIWANNGSLINCHKNYTEIGDLINGITETTSEEQTIDTFNLALKKLDNLIRVQNQDECPTLFNLIALSYEIKGVINELSIQYKNNLFKK